MKQWYEFESIEELVRYLLPFSDEKINNYHIPKELERLKNVGNILKSFHNLNDRFDLFVLNNKYKRLKGNR